jgi:mono/diheme cytochrome c family protein
LKLLWFLLGVLAAGAAAIAILLLGTSGFSAREQPSALEKWLARRVRSAAVPRDASALTNPVPDSPEVQAEAREHWADHCAVCHGSDGSGDTPMGKHTWPPAPDMRQAATQQLPEGELFYVIQNGVRFTAMPAWGSGSDHDAADSWKLVRFIRHLPQLTPEEKSEVLKLTPKTPDEIKEEQEEEKFLKGETNEPESHMHRHR